MKNILFFGDSLTAGYGLANPDAESYPALIQHKIDELELNYKVINAGLSGDTTRGGLTRLDYWLGRPIDVFVLELGINDAIRQVPASITQQNLQLIIEQVLAKYPDCKIVLMGMELPGFLGGSRVADFKTLFGAVADKYHLAFVPFFLDGVIGKRHLNLPDRLHPSAAGYKVIAENVWPVIKGALNPS